LYETLVVPELIPNRNTTQVRFTKAEDKMKKKTFVDRSSKYTKMQESSDLEN
jgi:hypothetical protein